jgi:hypothetical protein
VRFFCVSHPHLDHIKGFSKLVTNGLMDVEELWHSMSLDTGAILRHLNERSLRSFTGASPIAESLRETSELGEFLEFMVSALHRGRPKLVRLLDMRQVCNIAGVRVESLSPSDRGVRYYLRRILKDRASGAEWAVRDYANRISSMLLLTYGENRILLTGDALRSNFCECLARLNENARERELPYEVVKVPHHGSRRSVMGPLWGSFSSPVGYVCVSADGVRGPSDAFYAGVGGRRVYCTNAGRCTFRTGVGSRVPGVVGYGAPCCGNIGISVGPTAGDITVKPDKPPCTEPSG